VGLIPPLDLIPQPLDKKSSAGAQTRVEEIMKLHEQIKVRIEKPHLSYKTHTNKHKNKVAF